MVDSPFIDGLVSAAIVVLVAANAGLSETSAAAIVVLVAAIAGLSETSAVVGAMGNAVEGSITTMVDLPFIDELISAAIVVLVATNAGISEIGTSVCADVVMDTAITDAVVVVVVVVVVAVVAIGVIVVAAAGIRVTFWEPCAVCRWKDSTDALPSMLLFVVTSSVAW